MWIVKLALRRTYTFVVMAMLIGLLGGIAAVKMPTDIFPEINIPVVSVIFTYTGISPDEMEKRIATIAERAFTTTVNDIEHIESQSLQGVSVMKVFFHPNARVEAGVAQITATSQSVLRVMPPNMFSPFVVRYNASSVPILQLAVSGAGLSEQQLYDYGTNFIRTQLATVQGASVLTPLGGKPRQIVVDLNPEAMYAKGISAADVSSALSAQNLILPAGTARLGEREYTVRLNSSPEVLDAINSMPIRQVNGATLYIRDVAHVHDGAAVQNNIVRQDGRRSAFMSILKSGGASTLDIIDRIKATLPKILATLPENLEAKLLFDQSVFVRAAIDSVLKEALIAAILTGLMILLFLGSWRSTLIVCISIPLSILTSLTVLFLLGQTINVMTLGGLALAVGILVDDATVEIENIHRNLAERKPLIKAILDGAQQIAVPAFVSTLAICIVFVPVVLLTGTAKYLFTPLAMAVVFAMLASYLLSRTLIPTMVKYLLRSEIEAYMDDGHGHHKGGTGVIWAVHNKFNEQFERWRKGYVSMLTWCLGHRALILMAFTVFSLFSGWLALQLGYDFFPSVDAGQFRLHVRGPAGMRVESTEELFSRVEGRIRQIIPPNHLEAMLDNIGLPALPISLAYGDSATIGPSDGEILVSLKEEREHGATWQYIAELREKLPREFPEAEFFFQPADIVSQILSFGKPAPINLKVVGRNLVGNYKIAQEIERRIKRIPGAVDVHIHQVLNAPELRVDVDRVRADQLGLTQRDVASSLLISLSSQGQIAPNYWLNPQNGVSYPVAVQTPPYRVQNIEAVQNTPVTAGANRPPQLLSNVATIRRSSNFSVINHYNVQPVVDVYANVQGRDLGSVAADIDRVLADVRKKLPRGTTLMTEGQVETMRSSFIGLGTGLVLAVLLVYFLMVVNFQSWLDPFIILTALPGAFCGIIWMLYATQTTLSVPALMGAIMSIGVATANSILLVTFANERLDEGASPLEAAISAGFTRLRPVIMTALAMILGMLPMSLGLGEGGEQNAPLGRAVIGGLTLATVATLFFVPVIYSLFRRKPHVQVAAEEAELLQ
ncbi:MAG TPA: efflux RND transporter permease subunit [Bryobacteraceae bacterium]|nr:efflux RND transporter permease subunit [Bryobacteraceae bacterium]